MNGTFSTSASPRPSNTGVAICGARKVGERCKRVLLGRGQRSDALSFGKSDRARVDGNNRQESCKESAREHGVRRTEETASQEGANPAARNEPLWIELEGGFADFIPRLARGWEQGQSLD